MAQRRHLQNAPITEALADIRAVPTQDLAAPEAARSLKKALESRYPTVQERRAFEAQFQLRPGQELKGSGADRGLHGYVFESADKRNLLQFRVDGFTHNRLKPYSDGHAVIDEAIRGWRLFLDVARPLTASRIALRYINHLRLPPDASQLDRYMIATPQVTPGSPGRLSGFSVRISTFDAATGFGAITTRGLEPGMPPESLTLVIDIDAYCLGEFPVDPDELTARLADLRIVKNEVFFGSVTDEALTPYL